MTRHDVDVVVLGLGVRPRTGLAKEAGLPLGAFGGLLTDPTMRVRGQRHVWAAGDCVEVHDLVTGQSRYIPLGTHANKQGQVVGYVGSTGNSTGNHLHYEIRINGRTADPLSVKLPRDKELPAQAEGAFAQATTQIRELMSRDPAEDAQ